MLLICYPSERYIRHDEVLGETSCPGDPDASESSQEGEAGSGGSVPEEESSGGEIPGGGGQETACVAGEEASLPGQKEQG